MQDLMAPYLEAIKGEIASVKADIRRFEDKMDVSFKAVDERFNAMVGKFNAVDGKFNSLRNELKADIARVDEKLLFTKFLNLSGTGFVNAS